MYPASAKLVEKYSSNTALYECKPPMRFIKPDGGVLSAETEIVESNFVVIHNEAMAPDYHRTVIHFAEKLQGDDGITYGAQGNRILDGVSQHSEALAISGYKLQD